MEMVLTVLIPPPTRFLPLSRVSKKKMALDDRVQEALLKSGGEVV